MQFRNPYSYDKNRRYSLKEVIEETVDPDPYSGGTVERLREQVENLTSLVSTLAEALVTQGKISVEDLNLPTTFEEVKDD